MFCTQCGQKLSEDVNFCEKCGKSVSKSTEQNSPKPQEEQPSSTTDLSPNTQQLLTYLKEILHCESSIIGFESTIQENQNAIKKLCIPRSISSPIKPAKPMFCPHG